MGFPLGSSILLLDLCYMLSQARRFPFRCFTMLSQQKSIASSVLQQRLKRPEHEKGALQQAVFIAFLHSFLSAMCVCVCVLPSSLILFLRCHATTFWFLFCAFVSLDFSLANSFPVLFSVVIVGTTESPVTRYKRCLRKKKRSRIIWNGTASRQMSKYRLFKRKTS